MNRNELRALLKTPPDRHGECGHCHMQPRTLWIIDDDRGESACRKCIQALIGSGPLAGDDPHDVQIAVISDGWMLEKRTINVANLDAAYKLMLAMAELGRDMTEVSGVEDTQ